MSLTQNGVVHDFSAGEQLLLAPGFWKNRNDSQHLLLTADPQEGDLSIQRSEISDDPATLGYGSI